MSDELVWAEDEDGDRRKKHRGPTNGMVILCTVLVVGVAAMVLWVFGPTVSPSGDTRVREDVEITPGYYGKTRAIEALPANLYEAGVVRSILSFDSGNRRKFDRLE